VDPIARNKVIVETHGGKVRPIGTLRSIIKGSGIPEAAWVE